MLKKFALAVLIVLGLFLAYVASKPSEFKIERSTHMRATPAQVSAFLTDLHAFNDWSPWAKLDPAMKTTYSGPASGVGSVYEWSGSDKVGSGRMTIADVKPNAQVGITLEFLTPYPATNRTEFELAADGELTNVTWRMTGHNNFMAKAFGLIMNMDQMVGGDFEKGLGQLKDLAEASAEKAKAAAVPAPESPVEPADAGAP